MREIRIPALAKVNLRLDILGKRPDTYHELRTIFQTISLHDELKLRSSKASGIRLTIQGNEVLSVEPVRKNLVYAAVDALRREFGVRSGVETNLRKNIPAGRGLGGGSSDAAAALLGYLRRGRRTIPAPRLMEIATSLGADVPFCLFGGRALGIGRGDEIYPLPDVPKLALLVVSPHDIHVPTPDAYRWLKAPALTKNRATPQLWEFCALYGTPQGRGLSNHVVVPFCRLHPLLPHNHHPLLPSRPHAA